MDKYILALRALSPKYREIANKWNDRQKLEEELGIPTSNTLTQQFIAEEIAELVAKQQILDVNKKIGDFVG
tara:strand:+ start:16298 stop:16510 length:213 start_codon:yes stop_codon:yes gene_type:complete